MAQVNVQKLHALTGHKDSVYVLEDAPGDGLLFSGAGDGMVVLWNLQDPENGQLIAKLPNSIYGLQLMPESDILLVGHNYDGIHALDWRKRKERWSLNFTKAAIFDIQHFGQNIFVGDASGVVTIIDAQKHIVTQRIKLADKSARSIAINEARGELAVGYSDHQVRILDLHTYELKYTLAGHTNSVFTVRYSPDGDLLLTAGRDAHLRAWDVNAGYLLIQDVVAHMYAINNIDFSPDNKHFVTCSMDKSIKVWDISAFKLLKVIDKARHAGHGTSVNRLLWSGYNDLLVSASDDRTISVWDLKFN